MESKENGIFRFYFDVLDILVNMSLRQFVVTEPMYVIYFLGYGKETSFRHQHMNDQYYTIYEYITPTLKFTFYNFLTLI